MAGSLLQIDETPPASGVAIEELPPLITGETTYLVAGAVSVIVIFTLLIILIGRWRVNRRAREAARNTDFFQPAGEGAEITFDEMEAKAADAFVAPDEPPAFDAGELAAEPPREKKKSGFSLKGLFGKRQKPAHESVEQPPVSEDFDTGQQGLASVSIERSSPSVFAAPALGEAPRIPDWATIEREDRLRAERDAAERFARERSAEEAERRRQAEDELHLRREEEGRQRAAEQEAIARFEETERRRAPAPPPPSYRQSDLERHGAHDDIVRTLSEVEEALHAQREAIQAETRTLLDGFARRFSERLDALAMSVERRGPARLADQHGLSAAPDDVASIVDLVGRRLDEHRDQVAQALNSLSKRFDSAGGASGDVAGLRDEMQLLRRSISGREEAAAPVVQLSDIVRDALPPSAYEFNAVIANNRRADCLVRLPFPPGPIAIDAKFPIEAFHALHQSRDGETEFRRAALRHVVDIAERLIAPGVTADSAMMFVPSESMYAEIHARFPEVVQDSYRAHVWIVSPTTLMATLHTLSAVLQGASPRGNDLSVRNDAQRALAEIERLRARVAALEKMLDRDQTNPLDVLSPREPEWRPERSIDASQADEGDKGFRRLLKNADNDTSAPIGDLYADENGVEGAIAENEPAPRLTRPPFPLR